MKAANAVDRRKARPLRDHAQALFDTLRDDMARNEDNSQLVLGLKSWRRLEDVMLDCPALVPLVLEMAWRRRDSESFLALFASASSNPVRDKKKRPSLFPGPASTIFSLRRCEVRCASRACGGNTNGWQPSAINGRHG